MVSGDFLISLTSHGRVDPRRTETPFQHLHVQTRESYENAPMANFPVKVEFFLKEYLKQRPLFLSLIRAKEAEFYQKHLPLKGPVVDVGCGDGFFAKVAFTKKFKVNNVEIIDVGLDLEESRVEEARTIGIYRKLITYDGKHIPFSNNSFSTVVSNCVLEHAEDLNALVSEIYRVLRPGGLFFTTVMAKPWEENLFGAIILGEAYKRWMRNKQVHRNLLTKNHWDKVFQSAGFKIDNTIGYLSPQACQLIDICHYLSVLSLIFYKLIGKWILFPQLLSKLYPVKYLSKVISEETDPSKSGAIFYLLEK